MKRFRFAPSLAGLFLSLGVALTLPARSSEKPRYPLDVGRIGAGPKELAASRTSMVTSAHPFATEAGLEMLRRGGNAMDAAVAATMVTAVVDYGKTSFAGGGQLTYWEARTGRTVVINHEPNAVRQDVRPYSREREAQTGRSIRVPGSIAGFHLAVEKYGRRPWKEVLEPAIFYADSGYPINDDAYANMREYYAALTLRPSARKAFAPEGFLPPVNSLFKQPEMAATLRRLAEEGPDFFYRGELGREMVEKIRALGGKATLEDWSSYRAEELEPVWGSYKGYRLAGPPPPATGIVAIIEGFNILEHVDLKGMGHYSESADSLQWLLETLRVMFEDARRYTGVAEFDRKLGELLMSKDYARSRYEILRHKIELTRRSPVETTEPAPPAGETSASADPDLGTNHVAVIDQQGNVCSYTHTIYGSTFSSHGLWVGGIVLNDAGGFPAQPGGRIVTPMAPLIVFQGERPYFATGSAGGTLNTFLTALNVLAWDKNLKAAQEAPRLSAPGPNEMKVSIENRIEPRVAEEIQKRGYTIDWAGPFSKRNAQMAGIDLTTGIRYGAPDPRGEGHAAGQP